MTQDAYYQSPIGGKTALDVTLTDTPIPVYIVPVPPPETPEVVTLIYNGVTSVPTTTLTTLVTYTVPVDKTFYAIRVEYSGTNIALYQFYLNGVLYGQRRTFYGVLDGTFDMQSFSNNGYKLNAGDIITVKVEHFKSYVGDFDGTIVGLLVG